MLRKVVVVGMASLFFVNAFGQQEKSNPYVENMQQTFDHANAVASAQFSKEHPAPRISPQSGEASPAATEQAQPLPPPPPPIPVQSVAPAPQPIKKIPDVAVNSDKSGSSSVGNIYAPSGNTQNSDANNGAGTINPYR